MTLLASLWGGSAEARDIIHGNIAVDTTWGEDQSPYLLTGTIELAPNAVLVIQPGVSVHFQSGARLMIYGRLEAEKVHFDGGADVANRETIAYRKGSTGILRRCILQNLELVLDTSAVTVTDSLIANHNGSGITVAPQAAPFISGNIFQANGYYGLYKAGEQRLNAPDNYWGAADGPSGAGPGSGDAINRSVDFIPFQRSDMDDHLFLADRQLDRTVLGPGGYLTLTYVIDNLNSYSHSVILGATIYQHPDKPIHSQAHDREVTITPGRQRFTRSFTIPEQTPEGRYDVLWGVMKSDLSAYYILEKDLALLRVGPESSSPPVNTAPGLDPLKALPSNDAGENRPVFPDRQDK